MVSLFRLGTPSAALEALEAAVARTSIAMCNMIVSFTIANTSIASVSTPRADRSIRAQCLLA
jgi:hypothetical protein